MRDIWWYLIGSAVIVPLVIWSIMDGFREMRETSSERIDRMIKAARKARRR